MSPSLLDTDILSKSSNRNAFSSPADHGRHLRPHSRLMGCRQALGRPQKDADLFIAATALEHDHVLVTGNIADFSWITGLRLEDW